jgi:hypothetical protein
MPRSSQEWKRRMLMAGDEELKRYWLGVVNPHPLSGEIMRMPEAGKTRCRKVGLWVGGWVLPMEQRS